MNFKYLGILIIAFFCLFPVLLLQMIHHGKVRESRGAAAALDIGGIRKGSSRGSA